MGFYGKVNVVYWNLFFYLVHFPTHTHKPGVLTGCVLCVLWHTLCDGDMVYVDWALCG